MYWLFILSDYSRCTILSFPVFIFFYLFISVSLLHFPILGPIPHLWVRAMFEAQQEHFAQSTASWHTTSGHVIESALKKALHTDLPKK